MQSVLLHWWYTLHVVWIFSVGFYLQLPRKFTRALQVVAYDFGIKSNILRRLTSLGCDVTVVPAQTPAADVLAMDPDGVFLSNGPVRPSG